MRKENILSEQNMEVGMFCVAGGTPSSTELVQK